ncbi:MAG: Cytochrome c biogenesis protein CcsA [Chlamydiales bacterium]|nr:Cytochrome c biogenesis protein CcsA [Chlamydiales bacterium]MCH9636001.1 Cytochrome c biogenesis protein CcsA [Chlamydiales bacterium]MCH9703920.1 cytochrome c biogenesis protein CcsA [Chlamydiota bacterium]
MLNLLLLIPILFNGRVQPQLHDEPINVPQKNHEWTPLGSGQPIYPPEVIEEAKSNPHVLEEAYQQIAGTPYLQTVTKTLYYPSLFKLRLEYFVHKLPLTLFLVLLYLLSLWRRSFFVAAFIFHTALLAVRCYILGRPPVSNMMETILYVPWVTSLVALIFHVEKPAAIASSIVLLFLPIHQQFESVQAVLDSTWWLTIHVLMVVGSYGLFILAGILGHLALLRGGLTDALLKILYLGTGLLICGTILGGVWAMQSWGRFWDWDPKESWAFISSGFYLIGIHAYRFSVIKERGLAIIAIVGLLFITFTWYGVNYILGTGLHSYGFGEAKHTLFYVYIIAELLFLIFSKIFIYKNRERLQKKARKR